MIIPALRPSFASTSIRSALVLAPLLLVGVSPVAAQQNPPTVAWERIEAMRSSLLSIAQEAESRPTAKSSPAAKQRIEHASDEELSLLYRQAGPYLSYFDQVLANYSASLAEVRHAAAGKSDGLPEAPYPTGSLSATYGGLFEVLSLDIGDLGDAATAAVDYVFSVVCSEGGDAQTERLSYQARFNAKQVILAAELLRDVLGRVCDQEFYALGAGGDLSLACIASDLVFQFARPLEEFPAICDALIDSAEIEGSYDRLGHLHGDLETAQTSLSDLDSDLAAHDGDLAAHDDAVLTALEDSASSTTGSLNDAVLAIVERITTHDSEIRATIEASGSFFLQTFIERALFRELGNDPSAPDVYRLATLYLPSAFGGHLEDVRAIVRETIDNVLSSGDDVNEALDFFGRGDQALVRGRYKEAWDLYAGAYAEAVSCPRSNPACV